MRITDVEKQLMQGLADGLKYRGIAEKRCRSVKTVETQLHILMKKLQIHTSSALVAYGFRAGWLK